MKTNLLSILLLVSFLSFSQPNSSGLYFNGVDSEIIVPATSYINSTVTNNRTYETYFKVTNASPPTREVIMKEGGGIRAVVIYVEGGDLVLGAYNRADYTPRWEGTFYRTPIVADQWYHIALVFDNAQPGNNPANPMNATANSALKFYLDGVLVASNSGYQLGSHNPIRLGYKNETLRFPNCGTWTALPSGVEYCFGTTANDGGGGEYHLDGYLWGFRVWSDVRTPTEIADNMNTIITTVGTDNLVAALDGDTFTYLNSGGTPTESTVTNPTVRTWTGGTDTNWEETTNWVANTVPSIVNVESVVIQSGAPNYPELNSDVDIGKLTIETGASVTVNSGHTMIVEYDMTNDGTITVENGGSLLIQENKPIAGAGNYIIKRVSPNYSTADLYSIWSTPLTSTVISSVYTYPIRAFRWDASATPSNYVEISGAYTMVPGESYFIRPDEDSGSFNHQFSGTINNGDIDVQLYNTGTSPNMIGNPYPSALNWDRVYDDNSTLVDGTIHYWNHTSAYDSNGNANALDYNTYNSGGSVPAGLSGNISSCQGVFIKALSTGILKLRNSQKVAGDNSTFYKINKKELYKDRLWLKLSGGGYYSTMLLGYLDKATNGIDRAYDGEYKGSRNNLKLYSVLDNKSFIIQCRKPLEDFENDFIPLGFEAKTAGEYTIEIDQEYIGDQYNIILEDTYLGEYTNLRSNAYRFTLDNPIADNDRFVLRIEYEGVLSDDNSEKHDENSFIRSYFDGDMLVSKNENQRVNLKSLEVQDVLGKIIYRGNFENKINLTILKGVYFVKYFSYENKVFVKKLIKS